MDADGALPELDKSEIEDIVNDYRNIYSNVALSSAYVRKTKPGSSTLILSEWAQRNLERGKITKIQRTQLCDSSLKNSVDVNTVDISNCVLSAVTKSENLRAIVQSVSDKESQSKNYLEIWNEEKSLMTFDLTALDLHGPVYSDATFGSLSWSPQEDKLVYIAEKKLPKTAPFYQQKSESESDDKSSAPLVGEQYVYDDDWGEQLSPERLSVIAVCDIVDRKVHILDGLPEDICPGQVVWDPSGDGVVGVAFRHKPRRLGITFCTNRECCIFHLSLDGKYTELSDDSKATFSPRFSPNGEHLIWLQRENTGPHFTVSEIVKCDWKTKKIDVLVEDVEDFVLTKNGKEFHGVFMSQFPRRCWSSDSKYIVFSSIQKYRVNAYVVAVDGGHILDVGSEHAGESISILDISEDDYVIGSKTSFNQPTVLVARSLRSILSGENCSWNCLTKSVKFEENIIEPFTVYNLQTNEKQCYATYFGPKSTANASIPLIVYLHGGPHSTTPSQFSPMFHFLSHLGFGTLIVYFRGGIGCGKKFVDVLPGNVGRMDVDDSKVAVDYALHKYPCLDSKRVLLLGGSHGGFLVTHLSCQYPNDFVSTVARNPVTNLPAMLYTTDIPDWVVVEAGHKYQGMANVIDDKELWRKMADASPITRIKNVRTPTLLLLGKKDLRVPPFQGLSYYNMLKELNVPTKALLYDDNHSLSSVPNEMDSTINSAIWFKRCLRRLPSK